jgi:hypothetical protein
MSDEHDDKLSPAEAHIEQELTVASWAYARRRLEWKALYAGRGEDPTDRQMYLDAQEAASLEGQEDEEAAKEIKQRAALFLYALEKLSDNLEIARAEWAINRDPEELNQEITKLIEGW